MRLIQSFRAARWFRTTHLVLQAVLVLTLFGGLNYLAIQLAWRFDLKAFRAQSLSAETNSYLAQLKEPVRVVVTLTQRDDGGEMNHVFRDVDDLLREYAYATERQPRAKIEIEYLDVDRKPGEARQLNAGADTVLFLCGDRRREIQPAELYTFRDGQRFAFLGEQVFTSALLDVTNPQRKKAYFLTGHGELNLDNVTGARGLSDLGDALRERNFALASLNLAQTRSIPEDAAVILSIGAESRYDAPEQELIRKYLANRAGRLLLLLKPGSGTTGLEDLLFEWGLVSDSVLVYEADPAGRTDAQNLIVSSFGPHPITQRFIDNRLQVKFGASRTVRPNPSATAAGLTVTRLLQTSPAAWGERDFGSGKLPVYTPGVDLKGPLGLMAAAEPSGALNNLPFSVPVGRLVAIGSSDFVTNSRLGDLANLDLFFSAFNWLVDRDAQLNVPLRRIEKYQLALSEQEVSRLRFSILFLVPAAAALFGLLVYWSRRR